MISFGTLPNLSKIRTNPEINIIYNIQYIVGTRWWYMVHYASGTRVEERITQKSLENYFSSRIILVVTRVTRVT